MSQRFKDAVYWTYNGALGAIDQGQPLQIADLGATSDTGTVHYAVISGALPPGIDLTTGLVGFPTVPGDYEFVIRASSSNVSTDIPFTITVNPVSVNWATPAGSLGTYFGGKAVSKAVAAMASNGKPISYALIAGSLPGGLTLNPATGLIAGTLVNANIQSTITVRASYANGIVVSDRTFSITAVADAVVWTTGSNIGAFFGGDTANVALNAYSTSNSAIDYSIVKGALPGGVTLTGNLIRGTFADETYANSVTIRATGGAVSTDRAFSLSVTLAPTIWQTNGLIGTLAVGQPLPAFSAISAGGPVSYSLLSGSLPTGMTLNANGTVTGTAPSTPGTYAFTIRATDGKTFSDRQFSLLIPSDTITWATPTDVLANLLGGDTISLALSAASSNHETITYTLRAGALPDGLTLSSTGQISGKLTNVNGGYNYTIRANAPDTYADQTFTTNVAAKVITWVSNATQSIFTGHRPANFSATTSTANALVYSLASGLLPTGLTLIANGAVSGLATAAGTFSPTIRATDGGAYADQTFAFSVTADAITWVSNAATLANLLGGIPVNEPLMASSLAGDPVTYSVVSGTLPSGLLLSNGAIVGTPSNVNASTTYTVRASDGTISADLAYTSTVTAAVVTWVSNAGLTYANLGGAYTTTLNATTTAPRPVTYAVTSGALPTGLTLTGSTGLISGTPTGNSVSASFTVRATDGVGFSDKVFSLYVNGPPVWKTPSYIGNVATGTPFSITLTATDPDGVTYQQVGGDNLGNTVTLRTTANVGVLSGQYAYNDPNAPVFTVANTSLCNVMRATPVSLSVSATPATGRTIAGYYQLDATSTLAAGVTLWSNGVINGVADLYSRDLNSDPISPFTPPVWSTSNNLGTRYLGSTITIPLQANPTSGANASTVYYAMSSSDILPFGLSMNSAGVISGQIDPTAVSRGPIVSAPMPIWSNTTQTTATVSNNPALANSVVSIPLQSTPIFGTTIASYFVVQGSLPYGLQITPPAANAAAISGSVQQLAASDTFVNVGSGTWNTANGSLGSSQNAQTIALPLSFTPNLNTTVGFYVVGGGLPSGTTLTTTDATAGAASITGTLDGNATATSTSLGNARTFAFTIRALANTGGFADQNFTYTINVT